MFMLLFESIPKYKIIIELHVNGLEAMYSYITYNSFTTGQVRIKGHFSAQFIKKYIKMLFL